MASVVVVLRAALSLVFCVAGALKLFDPHFARGLTAFGLSDRVARPVARVLPWLELATGAALLWNDTALAGGVVALVMLGAFTVVIAATLRRGAAPPCNCFGAIAPKAIDSGTLWRNATLMVMAAGVIAGTWVTPGPPVLGGMTLAGLLAVLLVTTVGAWRRERRAAVSLQATVEALEREIAMRDGAPSSTTPVPAGLPIGAPVPEVSLSDADGRQRTLLEWLEEPAPVLLVALGAECGSCQDLYPGLKRWSDEHHVRMRIVAVYDRMPDQRPALGPHALVLIASTDARAKLRLPWTPGAVLISGERLVASPTAFGSPAVEALVTTISRAPSLELAALAKGWPGQPAGLPIGAPAEPFEGLPTGGDRILLFWRAGCPYCRAIKPAIDRATADPRGTVPRLVGINWSATEPLDIPQAIHVRDQQGAVAQLYGARGTPSAVRIGADGRVQSVLAAGGPDVLALLGADAPSA
jgi:hypothetical protein